MSGEKSIDELYGKFAQILFLEFRIIIKAR